MAQVYDRAREDLGNSVGLEHLNLTIPDQLIATRFYLSGMGFTRDPYLVVGLENMWVNIGRNQIHLPMRNVAQVMRGHIGLVVPDLTALAERLEAVRSHLADTQFGFERTDDHLAVTCPWGNRFRCYAPDVQRWGRVALGMPYLAFDVPIGTAEKIGSFYRRILSIPAETKKDGGTVSTHVLVGDRQHLIFRETDQALSAYDGHHIQLYLVNFSGPHRQLAERGLVFEESDQHQYRFKQLVDPDSGDVLYELEHEIRSITHPLYARPLVNRNPAQTNRDYRPSLDALPWGLPPQ